MSKPRPLIIAPDPSMPGDTSAQVQQLQHGDDLDLPVNERVARLELLVEKLVFALVEQGIDVGEALCALE